MTNTGAKPMNLIDYFRRKNGSFSRNFWATRETGNAAFVDGYWKTRTSPARAVIADLVAPLPADSLLEVGIHCGPNIWAITQRRRFRTICGTELSPFIAGACRERLPGVEVSIAGADDLPYADSSFDIVLCSNTLVCIGPESIKQALREIVRVSKRWLVVAEPFCDDDPGLAGRRDEYPNTCYWIRNYATLLQKFASQRTMAHIPKEHHIGHLNCVAVFEKISFSSPT